MHLSWSRAAKMIFYKINCAKYTQRSIDCNNNNEWHQPLCISFLFYICTLYTATGNDERECGWVRKHNVSMIIIIFIMYMIMSL